jgi:hypothetical protein
MITDVHPPLLAAGFWLRDACSKLISCGEKDLTTNYHEFHEMIRVDRIDGKVLVNNPFVIQAFSTKVDQDCQPVAGCGKIMKRLSLVMEI